MDHPRVPAPAAVRRVIFCKTGPAPGSARLDQPQVNALVNDPAPVSDPRNDQRLDDPDNDLRERDRPWLATDRVSDRRVRDRRDTDLQDHGLRVTDRLAIVHHDPATCRTTVVGIGDVFRIRVGVGLITATTGGPGQPLVQ